MSKATWKTSMIGQLKILTLVAVLFYPAISYAQYNQNVQSGMMDYTAVQPAGYQTSYKGPGNCPDCYSQAGYNSPALDYIEERSLHADDEYEPGPLDKFLGNITKNSWIRTEYLLWKISSPSTNKMLGEPLEGVDDPREGFELFGLNEFGLPVEIDIQVPKMHDMNLNDNNGIRMTYGVPLNFGAVEVSGFILKQASDDKTLVPQLDIPDPDFPFFNTNPNLLATSYTTDGALNTPPGGLVLYDTKFEMSIATNIWGAEANLVLDTSQPGEGIKIDPLFGFRYLSINEEFKQFGQYDDIQFLGLPTVRAATDSEALNNLYGGTAGLRLRFVHRWFTLGVEPKLTLGANSFKNTVSSTDFNTVNTSYDEGSHFAAIGELNLFARVHVHENVSLHVGWTGMQAHKVSRADENIRYQEIDNIVAARVDSTTKTLLTYGITAGGEIRF